MTIESNFPDPQQQSEQPATPKTGEQPTVVPGDVFEPDSVIIKPADLPSEAGKNQPPIR